MLPIGAIFKPSFSVVKATVDKPSCFRYSLNIFLNIMLLRIIYFLKQIYSYVSFIYLIVSKF